MLSEYAASDHTNPSNSRSWLQNKFTRFNTVNMRNKVGEFVGEWHTLQLIDTVHYYQSMKYQVKQMLQTQEIGQKPRFYTFWRRRYAKKICSQNSFDLKFSGNVKSGLKSLNSKFQSIWKILSWPKWSKTMILATLSLIPERQDFSRKNGLSYPSSFIMV